MSTQEPARPPPPAAAQARALARGCDRATLATLARASTPEAGAPHASLVQVAFLPDASPVLLVSKLAEHTKNLEADGRCSLLFDATAGLAEPLTGARVSLQGTARRSDDPRAAARYLARFPGASMYAGFADFGFWTVTPGRAHEVAGFGRIAWFEDFALDVAGAAALAEAETEILEHMNADHAEAIHLYATRLAGRASGAWTMTGVDPEGLDLREQGRGESARVAFGSYAGDAGAARAELVRLAQQARALTP
jgi:putative heme iron utilization protein